MLTLFSAIVCMEDVENVKPHPEPVEKALELLKAPKETTLFVGDTYVDIWSGVSAGVDTVLLMNERTQIPLVDGAAPVEKPTYIIHEFSELLGIVFDSIDN
jgi:pyrophosphatase PpaX